MRGRDNIATSALLFVFLYTGIDKLLSLESRCQAFYLYTSPQLPIRFAYRDRLLPHPNPLLEERELVSTKQNVTIMNRILSTILPHPSSRYASLYGTGSLLKERELVSAN
ncbi:hypothetical protein SAMN04489723_111124 [Algoriphagus aquimarinus]|uniref:Uncharacterized protein n=1 Tax=Algoriphagus aquimarinus TaxID=237018 RepID=A0A1I1B9M3_9BACT|nr:hypothetical protein SAMN04489723_111124 [Algoriphagus aquimarinus]